MIRPPLNPPPPATPESTCNFEEDGNDLVCSRCSLRIPKKFFLKGRPFVACAKPGKPQQVAKPHGLGDMVKAGLEAVGITQERAQRVAAAMGVKDCGCKGRQKALNDMGAKYLGIGRVNPPA